MTHYFMRFGLRSDIESDRALLKLINAYPKRARANYIREGMLIGLLLIEKEFSSLPADSDEIVQTLAVVSSKFCRRHGCPEGIRAYVRARAAVGRNNLGLDDKVDQAMAKLPGQQVKSVASIQVDEPVFIQPVPDADCSDTVSSEGSPTLPEPSVPDTAVPKSDDVPTPTPDVVEPEPSSVPEQEDRGDRDEPKVALLSVESADEAAPFDWSSSPFAAIAGR